MWRYDLAKTGDPLEWIYAQASSVRLVLELLEAASDANQTRLEAVFREHCPYRLRLGAAERDQPLSSLQLCFQRVDPATQDFVGTPPRRTWSLSPSHAAIRLSTTSTSPIRRGTWPHQSQPISSTRTRGAYAKCSGGTPSKAKFVMMHVAPSLIEVIWWHVASAAVAGDKQVKLCDLCHAPFIVTDRRQHFCPAATTTSIPRRGGLDTVGPSVRRSIRSARNGGFFRPEGRRERLDPPSRRRARRLLGIRRRHRHGRRPALPGLREALLDRA